MSDTNKAEAETRRTQERSLAYRYGPDTDEERALVLRHFPGADFPAGTGTARVSVEGLTTPSGQTIAWDDLTHTSLEEGTFSRTLILGVLGAPDVKIDLGAMKKQAEPFQQALAQYWQRHQVMRKLKPNPLRPDMESVAVSAIGATEPQSD